VTLMFGQELAMPSRQRIDLAQAEEVMTLDRVCVRGKRLEIEHYSLKVRAGEIIGLAGLDESGQELLMRAAAGLTPCFGGRVVIRSHEMTGKPYREYLSNGVVFGAAGRLEEGLIAGLTLTEHMALVSDSSPVVDWPQMRKLTGQKIDLYNVRGLPHNPVETLSGGNQQRVLMALLPDTPLVTILEQPTRGLDVESSQWIWEQLLERRARGGAIIFSSPELDEILTYSDRILVFYAGQIYEIPDATQTTVDELGHMIGGHFNEERS
jgi:simple sugar transport system ATP-binding protein